MPPKGIPVARHDYLEAINTSWKEQLLSNLVKLHNGDSLTFLEMSQVSTSYSSANTIGVSYQYGWGWQPPTNGVWLPSARNNAVTPNIGTSYTVSPQATYTPIKGENLRNVMMEPIPLVTVLKSLQAAWETQYIIPLTIESVNNLRTASLERKYRKHAEPPLLAKEDNKFFRFAELFDKLWTYGIIRIDIDCCNDSIEKKEVIDTSYEISKEPKKGEKKPAKIAKPESTTTITKTVTLTKDKPFSYLILDKKHADELELSDDLRELKSLIELKPNKKNEKPLDKMTLTDLRKYALQLCDINGVYDMDKNELIKYLQEKNYNKQEERYKIIYGYRSDELHNDGDNLDGEIVIKTRSIMQILSLLSQCIHDSIPGMCGIRESTIPPPKDAFVAVKYRDHWFYIDDHDDIFKKYFSSTVLIWSMFEPTSGSGGGAGGASGGGPGGSAKGGAGGAAAAGAGGGAKSSAGCTK